jgi:hypothetical protein
MNSQALLNKVLTVATKRNPESKEFQSMAEDCEFYCTKEGLAVKVIFAERIINRAFEKFEDEVEEQEDFDRVEDEFETLMEATFLNYQR